MRSSNNFIVLLPQTIIEIPMDSHFSWLTLFYILPKELVEKRKAYLNLPRNVHQLLADDAAMTLLQQDAFLELVWDCCAWTAWQAFQVPYKDETHRPIPGDWKNYSGDFPLWRLSYEILKHFRQKFESGIMWSFQTLFLMDCNDELPWLSYQHFFNLLGNLTDMIVTEQNWQPFIDEIWNSRDIADYSGKSSHKRDFQRSWNHDRNHPHHSLEEIAENGVSIDGSLLYDIPNPATEFESKVLDQVRMEEFRTSLPHIDKQILQLRMEGETLQEIARKAGFKTASAVSKHIEKIASRYEDFVADEYSRFLNKHTT